MAPELGDRFQLRASLLGPVQLAVGPRVLPLDAWSRRSARSLLLLLLLQPNHRLPRDRVLDTLWPDASPEQASAALRKAVHSLRRVLEPELVQGRASSYVEVAGEIVGLRDNVIGSLDVYEFERLMRQAQEPGVDRRQILRSALSRYRGHLLADEPAVDWCLPQREALRRLRQQAVLELAELDVVVGQPLATIELLEELLRDDPGDECALRALLGQMANAGQRESALRRAEEALVNMYEELGVEPTAETLQLIEDIRHSKRPAALGLPAHHDSLPTPPSTLIGRSNEIEALLEMVRQPSISLITLTGPGGTGKTRLALEVARRAAPSFAQGVCFVPLAAIRDHRLVLPAILRALGFDEGAGRPIAQMLHAALRDTEVLLVLDNLEQVIEAAPALAELLAACPQVTILATSREPLLLQAERLFPTHPLALPNQDALRSPDQLLGVEAVALFVERARAVRPDFELTEENVSAIAELCTRLDGLPLAIELAAARARGLPTETLLAWMGRRLTLLTEGPRDLPPRLQTMRDAIGWSYDLLTRDQQARFRRLAVFVGGFDAEAARAIFESTAALGSGAEAGTIEDVMLALCSLMDKSLVRPATRGPATRFELLETIREFGLERLIASDEYEQARQAHATYFRSLAERAHDALVGPDQVQWCDRIEIEHDNLRAALDWAAERSDAKLALRLSGALWRFWMARSYQVEGLAQLERALAVEGADRYPSERAIALARAGDLARRCGDLKAANERFETSLDLCLQLGNRREEGWVRTELGCLALAQRNYDRARQSLMEGLTIAQEIGDQAAIAHSQLLLARIAHHTGNTAGAMQLAKTSLELYRAVNDRIAMNWALHSLVHYAIDEGDLRQARQTLVEGFSLASETGYRWGTIALLEAAAALAAAEDHPTRALRLAGAASALREPIGAPLPPDWKGDLERQLAPARERLGESGSRAAWDAGRALSLDRAVYEAGMTGPT